MSRGKSNFIYKGFDITPEQVEQIQKQAKLKNVSKAQIVREALDQYLEIKPTENNTEEQ